MIKVTSKVFSSQLIGSKIRLTARLTQTKWRRDPHLVIVILVGFGFAKGGNEATGKTG